MPAVVVSIADGKSAPSHRAIWSLLEVARPGSAPVPFGILLADETGDNQAMRFRDLSCFEELEEEQMDLLELLGQDLAAKGREMGGLRLIESLEDSLSGFLRISDRTPVSYSGDPGITVNRLFEEYVDSRILPFISHLPLYGLRAAATRFGELTDAAEDGWILAPEKMNLSRGMFVSRVVGRSMEPRIPDGSLCVFRAPVVGSRAGRLLLIEKFDEDDISARYTVKKYARTGALAEGAEREQSIRLEPLNREFEAFDLESDRFRVVAEFLQTL